MNEPQLEIMEDMPKELVQLAYDGVHATYCTETQEIDITVVNHDNPVEITAEALNHEYLHYVLHKEIGEEATRALDNIDEKYDPLIDF